MFGGTWPDQVPHLIDHIGCQHAVLAGLAHNVEVGMHHDLLSLHHRGQVVTQVLIRYGSTQTGQLMSNPHVATINCHLCDCIESQVNIMITISVATININCIELADGGIQVGVAPGPWACLETEKACRCGS